MTGRAPDPGTVGTLHLRAQLASLEAMGFDCAPILASARLSQEALTDPDARFAQAVHSDLLRAALAQRSLPCFALELASHVPLGAYEVIDYLVLSSDTVLTGMHQLARYFRLISDALRLDVIARGEEVHLEISGSDGAPPSRFAVEYCVAVTLLNLARTTDASFVPNHVSFMHHVDDADRVARRLSCGVRQAQNWNGFSAPREAWQQAMPKRDPTLRRVLEQHAAGLITKLPEEAGIEAEVRRAIAALLPAGEVRIAAVARRLGLSPRTLQRRLAERGFVFQRMVEEVLKALAERYLRDRKLSIGEVAYLLGYSEPSAFHRAFRRWHGMPPHAYRRSS